MKLRGIVNAVTSTINPNVTVSVKKSAGYTIGAGRKTTPKYADPVEGPAQIQALDNSDLKQIDGLNLQGVLRAIYLKGQLAGIIRVEDRGGDLVTIVDNKGSATLPNNQVWLIVKVLESWNDWTKAVIQLQTDAS